MSHTLQDVAQDFFIHTDEQLLLGGIQHGATLGAHESSIGVLAFLLMLLLYLC